MARAMLRGSNLQCGDFTAAGMARADLSSAFLSGATFDRAILIRANLARAVANGCSLVGADLTACRLTDADLRSANLTGAVLVGCDLRGADLTGAQIEGVQGRDSVLADHRTRWPLSDAPATAARATLADKLPRATRRLVVKPVRAGAGQKAAEILEEIRSQQRLALGGVQGVRVSLPLGARAPRELRVRLARPGWMPTLPSRWPGTAVLRVDVKDTPLGTVLTGVLHSGGWERVLSPAALMNRPATSVTGTPYPSAVEELCARVLNEIDPRDGAPWLARAYVVHSVRRWDAEGRAAGAECREALKAAKADDPLGPVVNYALGALAYNDYDAGPMRDSIDYFTVANASAGRLGEAMEGLVGLCLTGMALAYSQLYHRFGMESENVVSSGRTTAEMAVDITRRRLMRPGLTPVVRRNATEGYALALYAEAFATHMTQREEDVRESIPLYEEAIARLEDAGLPVPAVLYNNLGYQYMTLEGLKEPGPDATKRYEKARALFERSVTVYPDLHFGWANLGNVDRLLRNPAAAEDSYRTALEICARTGTRYPQGWNELACVLLQLGKRDDEALESHKLALAATDSSSVRARLRAEYAESLVLVGKVMEAATVAEQGLAEDPGNRYCLVALAEARPADE
jgi:tetratricopeptide (TPR) repeat protein